MSNGPPIQTDALPYVRPTKIGGNQNYVDEVAMGFVELPAKELDDDVNVLYNGVNQLYGMLENIPALIPDGMIPGSKIVPGTITALQIANATITNQQIAPETITTELLDPRIVVPIQPGQIWNAMLAPGCVSDNNITDVSWSKLTGTPPAFPPSGAAGGVLAGTYPNPNGFSAGAIQSYAIGQWQVQRSHLSISNITPSLPPLPVAADANLVVAVNPAGTGLIYATQPPASLLPGQVTTQFLGVAPNGVDTANINNGAVTDAQITSMAYSKLLGAPNIPTALPPSGAAGGDLFGTYPNPTVVSAAGDFSVLGSVIVGDNTNPSRGRLSRWTGAPQFFIMENNPWAPEDPTRSSWAFVLDAGGDSIFAMRRAPNAAAGVTLTMLQLRNDGTLRLNNDPINPLDAVTKRYVDAYGTGPAGGSLAGNYPNPTLAPTGVASGTYGSSTAIPQINVLADGRLATATTVAVSIPPGTTVGPTPPASPAVGQMWWRNDPDGNLYLWYNDGNSSQWVPAMSSVAGPWSVSGSTLTPTDPTKSVLQLGATGATGGCTRLMAPGHLAANLYYSGGWVRDDATKPGWDAKVDVAADNFTVSRFTPGQAVLLTLDNAGNLTLPGNILAGPLGTFYGYSTIPGLRCVGAAGTPSAPTPVTQYTQIGTFDGWGCFQAGQNFARGVELQFYAAENWTPTAHGSAAFLYVTPVGTTNSTGNSFSFGNDGSFTITGATGQKSTGTTWANPSDRRLKDAIEDYPTGLAAILALQPRTFVYNGRGGSQEGLRGYGYIADEAGAIIPEMLGVARAKLNADDEEDTDIQSLDTSNITLALVNAIKELTARVVALETR